MSTAQKAPDAAVLLAANLYCYLCRPVVMFNAVARSRKFLKPATPRTMAEKTLWRKLFDRNPLFVTACDKVGAKSYALDQCPGLKTAAVLWAGTDPNLIPSEMMTRAAVLKANHGSSWNLLELDPARADEIRKTARAWINRTYGQKKGEWAYSKVRRLIFLEEALREDGILLSREYKFHVSCGKTAYVFVTLPDQDKTRQRLIMDRNGNAFEIDGSGTVTYRAHKPGSEFFEMLEYAEKLAQPFDFVRCDFYSKSDGIYFSELTVYPRSGFGGTGVPHLAELRSRGWDLRKSWFLTTRQKGLRGVYARRLVRWLDSRDVGPSSSNSDSQASSDIQRSRYETGSIDRPG
jgi:hypothetical protein